DQEPYLGRSLLAAPLSMTPRHSGVLVEMGTDSTEGLITAEWNYETMRTLWAEDDPPIRNAMPVASFGPALSVLYSRGLTLDDARRIGAELPGPAPVAELASSDDETMTVEAGEQTSLENDGPDAVEVP
ncbi:MAG: hypothetical protein KDI55_28250, partial [Anaerolineae bacterium]|nr:hypothetical protein [Anaerolineae bacterium]